MRLSQPAWPRALPSGVVIACATLGPVGRKLPAPGTWGSLAGLLLFTVFLRDAHAGAILVVTLVGGYAAVALCGEAEIRLRRKDPGQVILDEVIAMPLCFLGWRALPGGWPAWGIFCAGFALFRLFDIWKPLVIRRTQSLPGGWGVVVDDLVAALFACGTLHVAAWLWRLL